ncbi:MAG TPA: hypothetical protein VIT62_08945 [Lysobacter sp.]
MVKVEYRVRPVVRYVVTRWHQELDDRGCSGAGCETVGEYPNEEVAERVLRALEADERAKGPDRQYAIVQHSFEPEAKVLYAYGIAEAIARRDRLNDEGGGSWRIFAFPAE